MLWIFFIKKAPQAKKKSKKMPSKAKRSQNPSPKKFVLPPVERRAQKLAASLELEAAGLRAQLRLQREAPKRSFTKPWVAAHFPDQTVEWAKNALTLDPSKLRYELVLAEVRLDQTRRPALRKGQHHFGCAQTRVRAIQKVEKALKVTLAEAEKPSERLVSEYVTMIGVPFRDQRRDHIVKMKKMCKIDGLQGRAESPYSQGKKLRGGEVLCATVRNSSGQFVRAMIQGKKGHLREAFKRKRDAEEYSDPEE